MYNSTSHNIGNNSYIGTDAGHKGDIKIARLMIIIINNNKFEKSPAVYVFYVNSVDIFSIFNTIVKIDDNQPFVLHVPLYTIKHA